MPDLALVDERVIINVILEILVHNFCMNELLSDLFDRFPSPPPPMMR